MSEKSIVWFRLDLRLSDNPAFHTACQNGSVIPVYILLEKTVYPMGEASRWWLNQSLKKLNESCHGHLNVYRGDPEQIILDLCKRQGVSKIYWNRCYEPDAMAQDQKLKKKWASQGIASEDFEAQLLWAPSRVLKADGTPYQVFTYFYRNGCLKSRPPRQPISVPPQMALVKDLQALQEADWDLLPQAPWHTKLETHWEIGEKAAQKKCRWFLKNALKGYKTKRNMPGVAGTSRLSPHLHFGEISPNQLWYAAQHHQVADVDTEDKACFLSELAWREFSYHILYHFPELPQKPFQNKFNRFSWETDPTVLAAWQQGKTGYPIVDAGMRELWQTGYMHNRVRMIVASFLVKNLLIDWRNGQDWFWDCLVDADLANNAASWQWVAGSGMDAAPYFRIFNPVLQAQKFDPEGEYIRRFVPELAGLDKPFLFEPWQAPPEVLKRAQVVLGRDYPEPIVDWAFSRKRALALYQKL